MTVYYLNQFLDNLTDAVFVVLALFLWAIVWVAVRGEDDDH